MSKIVKGYVFWNQDITLLPPRKNFVLAISLRREMYKKRIKVTIRARYNGNFLMEPIMLIGEFA